MRKHTKKYGMFYNRSRSKKSNDRYKLQLPPGRMGCRNLPEEKTNTGAQLGGERPPLIFFESQKSAPIFGEKIP